VITAANAGMVEMLPELRVTICRLSFPHRTPAVQVLCDILTDNRQCLRRNPSHDALRDVTDCCGSGWKNGTFRSCVGRLRERGCAASQTGGVKPVLQQPFGPVPVGFRGAGRTPCLFPERFCKDCYLAPPDFIIGSVTFRESGAARGDLQQVCSECISPPAILQFGSVCQRTGFEEKAVVGRRLQQQV
jgi:hypothetical protein